MAVLTVIPTTDVKIPDVRDTLNANGGNVSDDLTTFFTDGTQSRQRYSGVPPVLVTYYPNANINKWSRFKPVPSSKLISLTLEDIRALNFAMSAGNFTASASAGELILSGLAEWTNTLPSGSVSSPYRLSDFRGYDPAAIPPINPPDILLWDVSSGDPCPAIEIPYKYSLSARTNNHADSSSIEVSGLVGADAYLCVMMVQAMSPGDLLVANAAEAMSLKNSGDVLDAARIEFRKFLMFYRMANSEIDFINANTLIQKYRLQYGINIITNRALGYVKVGATHQIVPGSTDSYSEPGYDLTHNGINTGTFKNLPEGNRYLDFYSCWMTEWMCGIHGSIDIKCFIYNDFSPGLMTISPGLTQIDKSTFDYFLDSSEIEPHKTYTDLEFVLRVYNNGSNISIDGETITKAARGESLNLDFSGLPYDDPSTVIHKMTLFLKGNTDSEGHMWLPKLRAFVNGGNYIYTQFEAADMTISGGVNAVSWKAVYDSSGVHLGNITTSGSSTILYNSKTYTRSSANDIYSSRVGDKYYGVKLKDSAGNYGDSYTIPAGETVYLDVRLRVVGNWYPLWAEGYSEYWQVDENGDPPIPLLDRFRIPFKFASDSTFTTGLVSRITDSNIAIYSPFTLKSVNR